MTLADVVKNFNLDDETSILCDELWNLISLNTQREKLKNFQLQQHEDEIFKMLQTRPKLLVYLAKQLVNKDDITFCEIGTAQGMQSLIFANCFPKSTVYTCDVVDHRHFDFTQIQKYENIKFILGESNILSKVLVKDNKLIDFIWVDGAHDQYSVVKDMIRLIKNTTDETIWVFDDFDTRFGCYKDLEMISELFREKCTVSLGYTASGQPNTIMIAKGLN
jgi:predicted O-methyltransferase YrrM